METNQSTIQKIVIVVVLLVAIALVGVFYLRPLMIRNSLPKPVVIDTTDQPTLGNHQAPIQIVAFEDLKCSNCARFSNEIMPYVQKNYIDTGKAKYTLINLAFINGSLPAANAAHCLYAQNEAYFFAFVDNIFAHQPAENQDWATIPTLMALAATIKGVNTDQFSKCISASPYNQFIQNNLTQATKIMGTAVSTPTVYINGILVKPLTTDQIDKIIKVLS